MERNEIFFDDVDRILFGQAPPEYLVEVLIRTIIVYTATLFVVKWLGKRMKAQLSVLEMAVIIMMGAIISVPMQVPDRGVLQGLFILLIVATLHFLSNRWSIRSERIERLLQGSMSLLVKDGVIQLENLRKVSVTKDQLLAVVRARQIYNLGQVKRLYMEDCGKFSIYENEEAGPGLSTLPEKDKGIREDSMAEDQRVCVNCGTPATNGEQSCSTCTHDKFIRAVY